MDKASRNVKALIFVGMVTQQVVLMGYKKCPYELAQSLDMTFEELLQKQITEWPREIANDCAEFAKDCPDDFDKKH